MSTNKIKILFLNQMAGPLFRELAEDIAEKWTPSILYTGHPDTLQHSNTKHLNIRKGPKYNKRNEFLRVFTWVKYFLCAFLQILYCPKSALLFFVSNPPFLPLLGYLLKKLRKQHYIVLVYDIHPDFLVSTGRLRKTGIIVRLWQRMNKIVYENADIVFTIGDFMAKNLEHKFDVCKTKARKVVVIPPWVDTDFIRPIPKSENWFAKKYAQNDKLTILYSGNLGVTHNIELIVDMARKLKGEDGIHFLIIGEGTKWQLVEDAILKEKLLNITLLPFQPEEVLPYSMATGDIAIVSMMPGTAGLMLPSKAYYYLAAGCYLLFVGDEMCEIAYLISKIPEIGCLVNEEEKSYENAVSSYLSSLRSQSRKESYQKVQLMFSRKNQTDAFNNILTKIYN